VRSKGNPAWKLAWREGIWPTPACTTMPKIECPISPSSMPERFIASLIAAPPSSGAFKGDSAPPNFPNGRPRRSQNYCAFHYCSFTDTCITNANTSIVFSPMKSTIAPPMITDSANPQKAIPVI
jgi:hypothetical protein